ncbi:MAG TPA: sulfatase-like hydrolase/transferase, partial [Candidatus Polarisedimenticolaceae bacterium]|nr:sulfatase-like hydrolase/transferase [Candidatus Polarisedimenticolaceae bacterium]
ATAPDTARSLTGLLTGYPFAAEPGAAPRPSLGELFSRLGYRTYALVEDGAVDRQLAPGFEEWNDGLDGADPIPQLADALARRAPSVGLVYLAGPDSLAPLSSGLAELPGYDRTLVVLTSDHGEPDPAAPVERGFRDSVVRVPLLVKFPAGGKPETVPSRTGSITSSIDLLPSLLALAGKDISGALPGSNVLDGYFSGSAFITAGDAWAFVQDNHKVVVRGEKAWVFDLAADPAETEDLTASRPDLARGLLKMAVEMRGSLSTDAVSAVDEGMDEETLEHLRSLGYIQ